MENKKEISGIYYFLLAVLIALQMVYTVYTFFYVKEGYMTDEIWSYGLSNSYYQSFFSLKSGVFSYDYGMEDVINRDHWISADVLRDYVTVQKGERFAYGSVYYNNTYDVHPPLYYMVLHTVCSFFPDKFSWWYGLSLNLVFLAGTQIFLFLTARKIMHSDWTALLVCVFYGMSKGALLTFTFIRQYALLTMLCMMFVYFSACFFENVFITGKTYRRSVTAAAVCAFLAFFTHYYGICFVGIFTALFCVYLFCKKKWWHMLQYGAGMFIALELFFWVYPVAFKHIIDGVAEEKVFYFSPAVQIRMLRSYLYEYNFGFTIGYFPTAFWNITLPLLGAALVGTVALLFPFRDEEWFWKLMRALKKGCFAVLRYVRTANYIPVFAFVSTAVMFELVAHTVDVWKAGNFVIRYVSFAYPYIDMAVMLCLTGLVDKLLKNKTVVGGVLLLAIFGVSLRVYLTTGYAYSFEHFGEEINLGELTREKNVLVIDRYYQDFAASSDFFTPYLLEAENVCFTSQRLWEDCVQGEGFSALHVDYVLVMMELLEVSEDETAMVLDWIGQDIAYMNTIERDDDTKTNAIEVDTLGMGVNLTDEREKESVCIDGIKELNGGEAYEILALMRTQRGYYYVVKFE